jgi:L-arabinonolactonase
MKLLDVIPAANTLGEGVIWDLETESLWWTDIQAKRLFRYGYADREVETFSTPERLGSFGLIEGSAKLVCAFETGIGFHEPGSNQIEWVLRPDFKAPDVRFNDGRIDRQGRFWAGTMVEGRWDAAEGALYSLARGGSTGTHATGISISNGICWSPDSTRFYFADSPLRSIFVYDFDAERGTIANRRVFARTPEGAYPDGATVDASGNLWSAHWGAGKVVCYSPDGEVRKVVETPATNPTCVAFGGPNLDLMFVTSGRDGLNGDELMRQPHNGDVFVYEAHIPGLADGRFIP